MNTTKFRRYRQHTSRNCLGKLASPVSTPQYADNRAVRYRPDVSSVNVDSETSRQTGISGLDRLESLNNGD